MPKDLPKSNAIFREDELLSAEEIAEYFNEWSIRHGLKPKDNRYAYMKLAKIGPDYLESEMQRLYGSQEYSKRSIEAILHIWDKKGRRVTPSFADVQLAMIHLHECKVKQLFHHMCDAGVMGITEREIEKLSANQFDDLAEWFACYERAVAQGDKRTPPPPDFDGKVMITTRRSKKVDC